MSKKRKQYSAEFKLKAVLELLKKEKTASQLAGELEVHPLVLSKWKKHFFENGAEVFGKSSKSKSPNSQDNCDSDLYEQIGRLKMENEWLKKKLKTLP